MNDDKDKQGEDAGNSLGEVQFAENFMAAAEKFYSNEKTISDRHLCFTEESIYKMVNSGILPNEDIRKHLFECSECFGKYRSALKNKSADTSRRRLWDRIFDLQAIKFVAAGAAACIIFALIILSFWRLGLNQNGDLAKVDKPVNSNKAFEKSANDVQNSESQLPDEVSETANNTKDKKFELQNRARSSKGSMPAINSRRSDKNNSPSKIETNSRSNIARKTETLLILDENRVLRNRENDSENQSGRSTIELPARRLNLSVKLPRDYPSGQYSVRVTDAFGNVLRERQSAVKNSTLTLKDFDLTGIDKSANKICLKAGNEIPDCFDIKILK